MRFHATLLRFKTTATGFVVPPEIVGALGGGKRPPVLATVNGHTFRGRVAPVGGEFLLGLRSEVRQEAGVRAGDELEVVLELDTEPREVEAPQDLADALDRDPAVRGAFDRMAYSHRKEHVRAIEDAKTPETRARRIEKAVAKLREGLP